MRCRLLPLALLLLPCVAASASAQPLNEGFRFGYEHTIIPAAELDADKQAKLKAATGFDLAVGFAYYRAFVGTGSFSLWNWGGRHVLFDGDNVFELGDGALADLLGPTRAATLRPPLFYRVPLGLVVLLLIASVIGVLIYRGARKIETVERLASDVRYAAALEIYQAALPPPEEETTVDHRRAALATAIDYLHEEHKVPREEAAKNARLVIATFEEARSKDLRYQALLHEQAGEWDEALDLYEEAVELRDLWDEKDRDFLRKCIARVEQKQAKAS
jgi:tetratricopeptide (TPR) repeat protein